MRTTKSAKSTYRKLRKTGKTDLPFKQWVRENVEETSDMHLAAPKLSKIHNSQPESK